MLLSAVTDTLFHLQKQRSFLKREIKPWVDEAMLSNDGSLGQQDAGKIFRYYGLAVPAILGEAFCALQGRKMTGSERICSTAMGAMTGLFDDFFDKELLDESSILSLMNDQENLVLASNEKLFRRFFSTVLKTAPDRKKVMSTLTAVYHAQVASKSQAGGTLDLQQVINITWEKGGSSLLFYRSAFNPDPSEKESQVLYRSGGLMQLSNDIFDIYKDREAGIQTLATITTDIRWLREHFKNELRHCFDLALSASDNISRTKQFLSLISLGIFSRVLVCLEQLESLQQKSGGRFELDTYKRKDLICDMDTFSNQWRSGHYYRRIMRGNGSC